MAIFLRRPSILIVSVLGGRASVARRHIELLLRSCLVQDSQIVLYVTHPTNSVLLDVAEDMTRGHSRIQVISKDFSRNEMPSGFDFDYDTIIQEWQDFNFFLCLHDDTFVSSCLNSHTIVDLLSDCGYCGYLDHNTNVGNYKRIFLDGIPFSKLRIGTWFLCGRLPLKHRIGCGRFFLRKELEALSSQGRLKALEPVVWLNGGCLLNIRARLDGEKCLVLKDDLRPRLATHTESGTWDLVKTHLFRYEEFDTPNERKSVERRLIYEKRCDDASLYVRLKKIAKRYTEYGISDPVVNEKVIDELFSMQKRICAPGTTAVDKALSSNSSHFDEPLPCPRAYFIETSSQTCQDAFICGISPPQSRPAKVMNECMFESIINQISRADTEEIHLYLWNEPMLDKAIFSRALRIRERFPEIRLIIATSRQLLTTQDLKGLKNACVDELHIYMPPVTTPSFENEARDDFKQTAKRIETIRNRLLEEAAGTQILVVGSSTDRYGGLTAIGFWKRRGFSFKNRQDLKEFAKGTKRKHLWVYGCQLRKPQEWMHISADGSVFLCQNDFQMDTLIGSLNYQQLRDIWLGKAFQIFRHRIQTGGPDRLPCHRCMFALVDKKV